MMARPAPVCTMVVALLVLATAVAPARPQEPSQGADNPIAFLLSRNIFDPSRAPQRVPELRPPPAVEAPPRVRTLVLTGSLVYPGKAVAFFSGSEPDYNQVVGVDQAVGPWTVRRISTSAVELAMGEDTMELPVGRQLVQQEQDPWALADPAAALPTPPPIASTPPAIPQDGPTPAAAEGGITDVMRRLMERRQKELSR